MNLDSDAWLQASLFGLALAGTAAFGAVEPWSRPLLGILTAAVVVHAARSPWRPPVSVVILLPLAALLFIGLFAAGNATAAGGPASWFPSAVSYERARETIAQLVGFGLALLAGALAFRGASGARRAGAWLITLALALTVVAFIQRGMGNNLILGLRSYVWGNPFGPILNYNHAADILILAWPAAIVWLKNQSYAGADASERWARRVAIGCLVGLLSFGLLVTSSRGAILSLAVVSTIWAIVSWKGVARWAILALAAFAPMGLYAFNTLYHPARASFYDDSGMIRIALWKGAISLLMDRPLFGVGPGGVQTAFFPYQPASLKLVVDHVHSEWLELILEFGLVGCVLAAFLAVLAFRAIARRWEHADASARAYATPLLVGIGAVALHQCIEFSLRVPAVAFSWALALGAIWSALDRPDAVSSRQAPISLPLAIVGIFLVLEGVPTAVAGGLDAITRYSRPEIRLPGLQRALNWRDDAYLHRHMSQALLNPLIQDSAEDSLVRRRTSLDHAVAAFRREPDDHRHRISVGTALKSIGRTADADFLLGGR